MIRYSVRLDMILGGNCSMAHRKNFSVAGLVQKCESRFESKLKVALWGQALSVDFKFHDTRSRIIAVLLQCVS